MYTRMMRSGSSRLNSPFPFSNPGSVQLSDSLPRSHPPGRWRDPPRHLSRVAGADRTSRGSAAMLQCIRSAMRALGCSEHGVTLRLAYRRCGIPLYSGGHAGGNATGHVKGRELLADRKSSIAMTCRQACPDRPFSSTVISRGKIGDLGGGFPCPRVGDRVPKRRGWMGGHLGSSK